MASKSKQNHRRRGAKLPKQLERANLNAAGIDVGARSVWGAVPEDRDAQPVREFSCYTGDLCRLADWLAGCGVDTVVMESTSVYWIPLYELLESRGFEVLLVNPRDVKMVPGRKSDVLDCQWLQQLHTYGLLAGSFRPPEQVCELRSYVRQRDTHVQSASRHIQHMQKALTQMNVHLHQVISDITSATGLRIIGAMLEGERDPLKLATLRDRRCKSDEQSIAAALTGNYREEHVFALRQAYELYQVYQDYIAQCQQRIERQLLRLGFAAERPDGAPAGANDAAFDLRENLRRLTGVDLTRIDGLDTSSVVALIAETGVDMSRWPSEKHFASWLNICPGSKISGGRRLSGKTRPAVNRAAGVFRMAAFSLHRSHSALGAYLRRMKARVGAPKATTATAHKIARVYYRMLKYGVEYVDAGQETYEQRYRQRVVQNLKRRAHAMGFTLVPAEPECAVAATP